MATEDIPKAAFTCHKGKFEFLRMPFGVKNALAVFQELMRPYSGNTLPVHGRPDHFQFVLVRPCRACEESPHQTLGSWAND